MNTYNVNIIFLTCSSKICSSRSPFVFYRMTNTRYLYPPATVNRLQCTLKMGILVETVMKILIRTFRNHGTTLFLLSPTNRSVMRLSYYYISQLFTYSYNIIITFLNRWTCCLEKSLVLTFFFYFHERTVRFGNTKPRHAMYPGFNTRFEGSGWVTASFKTPVVL